MLFEKIIDSESEVRYVNKRVGISFDFIPVWDIEGDRYLAFKSIMNMPAQRLLVFQNIQELEKIGIHKIELLKYIQEIKEFCKDGDTHSAFSKAEYIENNIKDQWDIAKTMRAVIPLCVVKESEIQLIGSYDQDLCHKNMTEIEQNPQMLEVFFYIVQKLIENSEQSALKSSNDFLMDMMKMRANYTSQHSQDSTRKSSLLKTLTNLSYKYLTEIMSKKTT